MEDQRPRHPVDEEGEDFESSERAASTKEEAEESDGSSGGESSGSIAGQKKSAMEEEGEEAFPQGDSFDFFTSRGERLDGTKALSLEILAEAGLKSAGKGRLRVDYTGVFQDMLRTLGFFPICVMAFSIVGFLLYRFPGNAGEWDIFQYLTLPSVAWLATWRWLETYYVLDVTGRKIDYHLQLGGVSTELGDLRREDLVGVSLTGQMTVDGWEYAVVAGLKNGKLVRISDYSKNFLEANRKAGVIARLLDTPYVEGRQEAFAEMQPEEHAGKWKIQQIPGMGPSHSGGGCILALELLVVPAIALSAGWFWGPLGILTYFWSRYWWTK